MKFRRNIGKQKISVDLSLNNYEALEEYKTKYVKDTLSRVSTTDTINECLSILLDITDEVREELIELCRQNMENHFPETVKEEIELQSRMKWEQLYLFLTNEDTSFGNGKNRKKSKNIERVDFTNGYLLVPNDWIFLNSESAKSEKYAYPYILEFGTGTKYGLPHFFLLHTHDGMSAEEEDEYFEQVCRSYPQLMEMRQKFNKTIESCTPELVDKEVFRRSLMPGFFSFPKYGGHRCSALGELWVTKEMEKELMKTD